MQVVLDVNQKISELTYSGLSYLLEVALRAANKISQPLQPHFLKDAYLG
jgi:hypothetical protein